MRYFRALKDSYNLPKGSIVWKRDYNQTCYVYNPGEKDEYYIDCSFIENNLEWWEEVWKCEKCDIYLTRDEDGIVFTICDDCYNKRNKTTEKKKKIQKLDIDNLYNIFGKEVVQEAIKNIMDFIHNENT